VPSLAQLAATCQKDSYYSRSDDEVWSALNRGGRRVYNSVCAENGGFFIKFDETSLALVAGTTEYALPASCTQIVHLAERKSSTDEWAPIQPDSLNNILLNQLQAQGILSLTWDNESEFTFYGPYLDSAASVAVPASQIQKIRISPSPSEARFCQLVYSAKWTEIVNASSVVMLPDEGTGAMERFASAALVRKNGDTPLAAEYEEEGNRELRSFLQWVRARQIQQPLQVEPYL
jgi:hypothetical protein